MTPEAQAQHRVVGNAMVALGLVGVGIAGVLGVLGLTDAPLVDVPALAVTGGGMVAVGFAQRAVAASTKR